jgi:hypothetical protein
MISGAHRNQVMFACACSVFHLSSTIFLVSSSASLKAAIPCCNRTCKIFARSGRSFRLPSCLSTPFSEYPGRAKTAAPALNGMPPIPASIPLPKPFAPDSSAPLYGRTTMPDIASKVERPNSLPATLSPLPRPVMSSRRRTV